MRSVEILLPNHLPHGFDYAVPGGMALSAGDYVSVPFGSRELPGVVWGAGNPQFTKVKPIREHYAHLPRMSPALMQFIDWVAWYTCSAKGAVLRMALPVHEALKAPGSRERNTLSTVVGMAHPVALSAAQQAAVDTMSEGSGFRVTLLDGVTGSGKTEVYFELIAQLLKEPSPQVLVMLPEIALSVQWLERFTQRFGFAPHVWHSGLPAGRRKHTWRAIVDGSARVVVGARSALFLPFRDLKLIIADEEHDGSYKQEDGVIYHARDMAVARSRLEKIPLVLASATPSLETMHNVSQGRYAEVKLRSRHGGAEFPDVQAIDMRSVKLDRGAFLSDPLRDSIAQAMALGQQSMLFLNRRGYAPLVLCRACGHRFQCPQCTAWLVLHKNKPRLQCHHCDYSVPEPKHCPSCQAEDTLHACGPGVERIAEEVAQTFPQARLAVLASDQAESYGALQDVIQAMENGAVDILVGTQMMAKGHHFANLALVGVVDADLGLSGGDLRAGERTYQLLHQIAGRAGRAKVAGRVLLQSFQPDHPVMKALLSSDREAFMALELQERERAGMPPFSRLCALIVEAGKEDQVASSARELAKRAPLWDGVRLLGPSPAPLYQLRGNYRYRLLLRADRKVNLQEYIVKWLELVPLPRNVRLKVDVDPNSFL